MKNENPHRVGTDAAEVVAVDHFQQPQSIAPPTSFQSSRPMINWEDAARFLTFLDERTDRFTFQTFTDSKSKSHPDPFAQVMHGTLGECRARLADLQQHGAGIYVTVNATNLKGRKARDIVEVRCYFADFDGAPLENTKRLPLQPHFVVESSPGRFQVYYGISDAPLDPDNFRRTQKGLSKLFGSDDRIHDHSRVMRVPGLLHQKNPAKPFLVRIMQDNSHLELYTEAQFQSALAASAQPVLRAATPSLFKGERAQAATPARDPRGSLAARALNNLGGPPIDWTKGYGEGHRNAECARRAGSSLGTGDTPEETLAKCLEWNKLNQPPLDDSEVEKTVASVAGTHARNVASKQVPAPLPTLSINAPPDKILAIRGDELLSTTASPRRWFVEKFVPAGETTMLGGDGGTGKTTLGLQLCVASVSGGDWIGLKVKPCNVLYVSAEDPRDEVHFRLEQITKHSKLSKEELARFMLIDLAGKEATIATFERNGQIKPTPLFGEIENAARAHSAGCIIFDSVADFFGGNENERREVRAFVGLLRGLAMRLDAAVIFLAHPSVDGIKTGRGYSGSTHWNNAVRSRLYFTEAPNEEGGQPPNPDLRMIELAKSNRARRGEKIHVMWNDGRFVELTPGAAKSLANETEAEELFLMLLSKLNKQGIHLSPYRSPSYAPTMLAKQPGSKGVGKAALERAMHQLIDKGKIRDETHGPPSKLRHRLVVEGAAPEMEGGQ